LIWFIQIGVSQRSARYQSGFHLSRRSSFPNSVSLFGKQDAQFKKNTSYFRQGRMAACRSQKTRTKVETVLSVPFWREPV